MGEGDEAVSAKWDRESLRRCENCGGKLVRVDGDLRSHLGHKLHSIHRVTLWEFIKIWVGVL